MTSWFTELCARDDAVLVQRKPGASLDRHHARLALEQMREALQVALQYADFSSAWLPETMRKRAEQGLALLDAPEPPREKKPQR